MAFERTADGLRIDGHVFAEEIESLLQALDAFPGDAAVKVDLSSCTHLHTGAIQLLMRRRCEVTAWPENADWTEWAKSGMEK